MTKSVARVRAGDLIGLDGGRGFNHGCTDYAILEYVGDGHAKVVEAQSCSSCWQVGHDYDHVFATVGDVHVVDADTLRPAGQTWATSVAWEID